MMGGMIQTRPSAEQWKQILREQQVSGLSVAAFCRQVQMPQASFYAWRKKLRSDRRRPGVRRPRATAGRFVEVKVPAEPSPRPSARQEAGGIELRLPGRRRVLVRPGFDRRTLLDLLAVLEAFASSVETREAGA